MHSLIFKTKKAEERILSVWMIFVWVIIAVGFFAGLYMFYSAQSDVRGVQDFVLSDRLVNCVVDGGNVKSIALQKDFDVYKECMINNDNFDKGSMYFSLVLNDYSGKNVVQISGGIPDVAIQCELGKKSEGKDFPVCKYQKFVVSYFDESSNTNKKGIIEVTSASKNIGGKL